MSKLNPKQAFFLIDDMANPRSGWDRDFRGADHYPFKEWSRRIYVKRVNPKYPTWAKREITRQTDGIITFETSYRQHTGDGFYLGFYDGDAEAVRLDFSGGFAIADGSKLFETSESFHHIKFELDIDAKRAKIYHDGKCECEIPFTGKADAVSNVKLGYEKDAFGETELQCCKMYKNYLVNDCVIAAYNGALPEEYTVNANENTKVYRRQYGGLFYNYVYSVEAGEKSVTCISRAFKSTGGKIALTLKYIITKENGNAKISLTAGEKDIFTLSDDGTSLCHKGNVVKKHASYTVWQTLRIDADTAASSALVYLNGKKIASLPFDGISDYLDGFKVEFESGQKGGEFMMGEIFAAELFDEPKDYVPTPVIPKKKGDYYVGINVCSLWRDGQHHGWDCITPYEDHEPVLGFYDEGDPEVADWEIKFMAEHGIDFQLYCWYAENAALPLMCPRMNYQWNTAHMYAKYGDKVKFALLWEAAGCKPESEQAFRDYYVPYWIDYYFSDERYMTIDGYAVMSIYGADRLISHMGGVEITRRCLDYLRSEVTKLGYKGLIILACGDPRQAFKDIGIDGTHAYNWGHEGYDLEYTKARNISNIKSGLCHQVPTISSGFNVVAWRYFRSPNMTFEDMQKGLEWARDEVLSSYEKDSWKSKLAILSTWNEYGEGTYMSPAKILGFGYLDAVRKAFCEDTEHTDIVPTDEQKESFCQLHPRDRYFMGPMYNVTCDGWGGGIVKRFEFKTQEDLDKWEFVGLTDYEIKDGVLVGRSTSDYPYMLLKESRDVPINTSKISDIRAIHRSYKLDEQMCSITIGFTNDKNPNSPRTLVGAVSNPKERVERRLGIRDRKIPKFKGEIYNFIVRPVWGEGYFELESIEFLDTARKFELYIDEVYQNNDYDLVEKGGNYYIPFNPIDNSTHQIHMYHRWNKSKQQLTVVTDDTYIFTVGCDKVSCSDGNEYTLPEALELYDGLPLISIEMYAKMLGKEVSIDGNKVYLK